jgi:hypothetical protein
MVTSLRSWVVLVLLGTAALGCSGEDDPARPGSASSGSGGGGQGGGDGGECTTVGATQCAGSQVQACQDVGGVLAWGAPAACPGEQSCKEGACADPTETQLAQAATLEAYVDEMVDNTGWPVAIDGDALKKIERAAILQGDGSDAVFFGAMRRVQLAVRQGHQSLMLDGSGACTDGAMFLQNYSRFGVCGRPLGDDIVVTYAEANNPLALAPGDRITAAGGDAGPALLEQATLRPVCGAVSPADSGRKASAAASFFGTVPAGMELVVQPVDGSGERTVTVPDSDGSTISCQDPLGRDLAFNAQASIRPDGVAVIRLPRFYPMDASLPQNPTLAQIEEFIVAFQQKIADEFDNEKDAPALVWDARGNYGGITLVGLAIAGGMPTAQATSVSYCTARVAGSTPPSFYPDEYAAYDVVPGGPFAYAGKAVVITDGLDYSAADYFPLAVRKATATPIVGTATAGAYGGPGPLQELSGPPSMLFNYDVNRCLDAETGEPLEGSVTEPDLVVEHDPADLARGIDTVLEAAVELVK